MGQHAYLVVSGAIFGIVAIVHVVRMIYQWPAQIGTWTVPLWVSGVAIVISGVLGLWALRLTCTCCTPKEE